MLKFSLILWLTAALAVHGQAVLEPPFGLKWADSPERLIDWANRHQLDVTITLPGADKNLRIVKVAPARGFLPASKARSIEARFHAGRMFELTVHHGGPETEADVVDAEFKAIKRQLGAEHGAFTANQQQRDTEDKFATRTLSFHREPVKGLFLLLAFTEVEDQLRQTVEAAFSVIYRNDNLRQQLEAATGGD